MASQYSHGHEFDVFISYSSRDRAWVQSFHDDLVADTNRFAKHDIDIFFDQSRLQPGFVWEDRLVTAARSAAIMLPVLSTRFFESEYCQKELKAFVEAHAVTSSRSHQSRVIPVNLLCAAPAGHVLNEFQAITFFTVNYFCRLATTISAGEGSAKGAPQATAAELGNCRWAGRGPSVCRLSFSLIKDDDDGGGRLWETVRGFPRTGGRVLGVHGSGSVHGLRCARSRARRKHGRPSGRPTTAIVDPGAS